MNAPLTLFNTSLRLPGCYYNKSHSRVILHLAGRSVTSYSSFRTLISYSSFILTECPLRILHLSGLNVHFGSNVHFVFFTWLGGVSTSYYSFSLTDCPLRILHFAGLDQTLGDHNSYKRCCSTVWWAVGAVPGRLTSSACNLYSVSGKVTRWTG